MICLDATSYSSVSHFITVTVYTIRGTNTAHVFPHVVFRPDGAIVKYIGVLQ
jgi:hypothetical protein